MSTARRIVLVAALLEGILTFVPWYGVVLPPRYGGAEVASLWAQYGGLAFVIMCAAAFTVATVALRGPRGEGGGQSGNYAFAAQAAGASVLFVACAVLALVRDPGDGLPPAFGTADFAIAIGLVSLAVAIVAMRSDMRPTGAQVAVAPLPTSQPSARLRASRLILPFWAAIASLVVALTFEPWYTFRQHGGSVLWAESLWRGGAAAASLILAAAALLLTAAIVRRRGASPSNRHLKVVCVLWKVAVVPLVVGTYLGVLHRPVTLRSLEVGGAWAAYSAAAVVAIAVVVTLATAVPAARGYACRRRRALSSSIRFNRQPFAEHSRSGSDADKPRPSRKVGRNVLAAITLAVAILGAVTGTATFLRAREVDLTIRATGAYEGPRNGVRVFPLSIVNNSLQSVNMVGGDVYFEGRQMGEITGVLTSPLRTPREQELNEEYEFKPSDVVPGSRRAFPFALGPGAGLSGAVAWRITDQTLAKHLLDLREQNEVKDRIKIGLRFIPGGTQYLWASALKQQFTLQYHAPRDISLKRGWAPLYSVDKRRRVNGLVVLAVDPQPYVLTLRVWSSATGGLVSRSSTASVGSGTIPKKESAFGAEIPKGMGRAAFVLPQLSPGEYVFAVTNDRDVVATGLFAVPCPATTKGERETLKRNLGSERFLRALAKYPQLKLIALGRPGSLLTPICVGNGESEYIGAAPQP